MPINVPATQVVDFTSRSGGGYFQDFTPETRLSSPMTGEVVFDYDISRNSYINIEITDMDGGEYPAYSLDSGWVLQRGPLRWRFSATRSNSPKTLNIPEGYQITHMHIGTRSSFGDNDTTVNHFSVTGFSEGLIDRVWYNEWIAEVYQGRDLIYKGPEPVEVEIEDLVGGEHVLSREVRCVGKELNPQHTGNMWMGITQWGLSKIPVGDTISVYIVVEDSDGNPVEELLNPDTYPNNGWSGPYDVPRHIQHPGSNYVEAGSVRGFGRLRLRSFGDFTDFYGEPAFGNSFELYLRDGERLTYMAVEYNTNSYPDNQLLPEFRVESMYFGPVWD